MWHNLERRIACLIMPVDRHLKVGGYMGQSHSPVNCFKMI